MLNEDRAKVLAVDDNPDSLLVLVDALGDRYQVKAARDGEGALRLVGESPPPDIILLDIVMPGIDGYEVCRRIKEDPATREIPVIFLSALTDEREELEGLALGAVDYVHKPVSAPLVQARIATHLQLAAAKRMLADHVRALEETARLRDDVENITQHDLKAPLTLILAYPDLLLYSPNLDNDEREMISAIRRAGFKMLSMINRSLDLYKLETGRYQYNPEPQELDDIIRSCLEELAPAAEQRRLRIDLSMPPLWANVEANLAYMLFSNLIKNAIEATPEKGGITIEMAQDETHVVARITNPLEVPKEMRDCFFDKYSTAGKDGGTGLGTYSAQLMVNAMKGDIQMETAPDFGTRITVRLPSK